MCLLAENAPIKWKYAYWPKMCILKDHNHLGINSSLYLFGNFFSISSY